MACEVCKKVYVPTEDILLDSDVKPHLCNTCGRSFSLKIQLKRHILTHANDAPYTCYSCEKNSDNQSKTYNLRLTKKGNYVCEKCNTSFSTRRLLLRHSKEHDVPELFICVECDDQFDTEQALKKHSSIHKVKRPYRRHSAKADVSSEAETASVKADVASVKNVVASVKNVGASVKNVGASVKNVGASLKNVGASVKNVGASVKNVGASVKIVGASAKADGASAKADASSAKADASSAKADGASARAEGFSTKADVAESSFVCTECGKSFNDMKSFEKHSSSHKRHPCADCSKTFATVAGLERHHKKDKCKPVAAKKDKLTSKSKNEVEENDAASEDKKHVCAICGKSFSRKSSLEGHIIIHMKEEDNESEIDDEYLDNDYVQEDEEKEEIDPEPPRLPKLKIRTKFRCDVCKEIFTTDDDLKKHETIHKNEDGEKQEEKSSVKVKTEVKEKKYNCRICSESFISMKKLDLHELNAHSISRVRKKSHPHAYTAQNTFMCEICDKVFGRKSRLRKHLLFHENKLEEDVSSDGMESIRKRKSREKSFSCETCGKRFAGKVCLDKHILRHFEPKEEGTSNGEASAPKRRKNMKELICEYCKEDFTGRKNAYIKHRNLHTPEVCGICDERFVDRQALREHCKSHIGTEEARVFLECSQKAFNAKNGVVPPEPKVEYIYLVLR